jgi:DNA-binding transcriptional LysR family regulator
MEAETNEAERALSGADARAVGVVRLTCGEGFAEYVLAPALPAFLAVHPGLTLEVRPRLRPARHADVVPGPRPAVPRVAFRANTTTLVHAACAAGAGVALLSCAFVEGDPRFARVLPRVAGPALKLWSVAHADLRASARVEVTLRFLEALVRRPGFELG